MTYLQSWRNRHTQKPSNAYDISQSRGILQKAKQQIKHKKQTSTQKAHTWQ